MYLVLVEFVGITALILFILLCVKKITFYKTPMMVITISIVVIVITDFVKVHLLAVNPDLIAEYPIIAGLSIVLLYLVPSATIVIAVSWVIFDMYANRASKGYDTSKYDPFEIKRQIHHAGARLVSLQSELADSQRRQKAHEKSAKLEAKNQIKIWESMHEAEGSVGNLQTILKLHDMAVLDALDKELTDLPPL